MRKQLISTTAAAMIVFAFSCFVRAAVQPLPGEEATKLARQLSDDMDRQDVAGAGDLFDTNALFDRLSAGVSAPAQFQSDFKKGFTPEVKKFPATVVKATSEGGSYHFLRLRQVNGETRALFRFVNAGGGVNYHDWIMAKDSQGQLRFADVYIAVTGETISQTMHRAYVQAVLAANPGVLSRLTGKDKELAANLQKFVDFGQALQSGQYQKALDDYKTLPTSLQEDKSCLVIRLVTAQKLGEPAAQEYTAVMADYKRLFPGDASVDLVCTDALLQSKQFEEARKALDRIDAFAGGDPYILVLKGNTYKLEGGDQNLVQAEKCFQKAIDQEPTLAAAYWSLVSLTLDSQKYDQTAVLLTQIQRKLHLKIADLTKAPVYSGFVKSKAYKKWLAEQPADSTPGK